MTKQESEIRRQQMIAMRNSGLTDREIGEHFGITPQAVYFARNRPMTGVFVLKDPKHQPAPLLSVADVLKIADKVSEETGRYPSYGKVVAAIENGSIDPWRYIRRKRRLI